MAANRYIPPHRRRRELGDRDGDDLESLFCEAFDRICCINLEQRDDKWRNFQEKARRRVGLLFQQKVERFHAIDGNKLLSAESDFSDQVALEWDTSQNALWDRHVEPGMIRKVTGGEVGCAMSHVALWKQLALSSNERPNATMLILEDDVEFLGEKRPLDGKGWRQNRGYPPGRTRSKRFLEAFAKIWALLPNDWGLFYLGFSDRGDRMPVELDTDSNQEASTRALDSLEVKLFQPKYGFHTHAYAIKSEAAITLLENLPVVGPIDVWLADNKWFGLKVYCGVVANEGWRGTGAWLAHQRKRDGSDVAQSGRKNDKCQQDSLKG